METLDFSIDPDGGLADRASPDLAHVRRKAGEMRQRMIGRLEELIARYAASRIPLLPTGYALSPDDHWLAVPLKDGGTTNLWVISTADGSFHQITDFKRPTLIARQVSWAPDGKSLYAAVVDIDADIMSFDGMLP